MTDRETAERNPRAWFAHDPLDGVSFFATEAEARAQAEAWLDEERDRSVDGWSENVEGICYGLVTGYVVQTKNEPAPEGSEFDYIADYALRDTARASSPPAWRKEPPTVEEFKANPRWWYRHTDGRIAFAVVNGDEHDQYVNFNGDIGWWGVRPFQHCPGEWSACLPPGVASSPSPGLVEAARDVSAWLERRGYLDLQCTNGIALGIDADFCRAVLALRAALPAAIEAPTSEPLAELTTVIHPDQGDGPYIELSTRVAVPRGTPGRRARVVVLSEE